jgi:hypothetical protein
MIFQKLLDMLFNTHPRAGEEVEPVTLTYYSAAGGCEYMVSWESNGHTHVYNFSHQRRNIVLTKAMISYGASQGLFSWDQATYAKELIDAMTEGVK